jgi:hypothetical protein
MCVGRVYSALKDARDTRMSFDKIQAVAELGARYACVLTVRTGEEEP